MQNFLSDKILKPFPTKLKCTVHGTTLKIHLNSGWCRMQQLIWQVNTFIIFFISLYSLVTMNIWVPSSSVLSNVTNACYMFILSFLSPGEDMSTVQCFVLQYTMLVWLFIQMFMLQKERLRKSNLHVEKEVALKLVPPAEVDFSVPDWPQQKHSFLFNKIYPPCKGFSFPVKQSQQSLFSFGDFSLDTLNSGHKKTLKNPTTLNMIQ